MTCRDLDTGEVSFFFFLCSFVVEAVLFKLLAERNVHSNLGICIIVEHFYIMCTSQVQYLKFFFCLCSFLVNVHITGPVLEVLP